MVVLDLGTLGSAGSLLWGMFWAGLVLGPVTLVTFGAPGGTSGGVGARAAGPRGVEVRLSAELC